MLEQGSSLSGTEQFVNEHNFLRPLSRKLALTISRTWRLGRRHFGISYTVGAVIALGSLGTIAYLGDDIREYISPPDPPLALGAGEYGGNNIVTPVSELPLKSISLPAVDHAGNPEAIDTSGWKLLSGPGFSLLCPNEEGWRCIGNRIILGPDGDEKVRIDATAQALKGKSFTEFVADVYAANKQNRPSLVTSQPANFPRWRAAGLDGEVIGYKTKLRLTTGKTYDERIFMASINGMVYQLMVSQELSQIPETDPKVNGILNSLYVVGTSQSK